MRRCCLIVALFVAFASVHAAAAQKARDAGTANGDNLTLAAKSGTVPQVPLWTMHEFELHGQCKADNPFRDATLVGDFTSPSGKMVTVSGFYDDGDTWRLRFTPEETGQWSYVLRGQGVDVSHSGTILCVASANDRLDAAFKLIYDAVEKGKAPGSIAPPGALVLVAHKGRIVRHEAIGLSDPQRNIPFSKDMLCWIASITKPVTVAAAITLVTEGKMGLDDPVEKYLPEFHELKDASGAHHPITIRHLMTHTSGIVNDPPTRPRGVWAVGGAVEDAWFTADPAETIRGIAKSRLLFKPGSQVKYSSAAFFVLGRVMEIVSGKPYSQLVKERILDPLGMKESCYAPPAAAKVSAIFAEIKGKREAIYRFKPELKITNHGPDGGLFSNPAEYCKFMQMFLDNDGKVLPKSAVREMLKEQYPGWGLGWALDDGCFHHGGSSGTQTFADPKTGTICIVFFQYRDRKDQTTKLAKDFWREVRAAFQAKADNASEAPKGTVPFSLGRKLGQSPASKGIIRVDPVTKYWFSHANGEPFYGIGDTCYGLVCGITEQQRQQYFDTRASQGFNFVRFFAAGYLSWKGSATPEAGLWPWGGTRSKPDYDRLNPAFFRRLEGILAELSARNMHAELLVMNYYSMPFKDPAVWTTERQNLWIRYLVSRLSANPAVFLWTVTNEYEIYPKGSYSKLGQTPESEHRWARDVAATIHAADPYHHPVTVHPCENSDDDYHAAEAGDVGRRFGKGPEIDVLSHQVNTYTTATWHAEPAPGFWDGPATGVSEAIAKDRHWEKPVINTENGYEWLDGYPSNYSKQVHATDKCRRAAWRTFVAGGAGYAAGFAGTWPGRDGYLSRNWKTKKDEGPLPFTVSNMGLARQIGHLAAFITQKTNFRETSPAGDLVNSPNLCLANPGREYIVYAPSGGTISLDLSTAQGTFDTEWLDPRSGEYKELSPVAGGQQHGFAAPDQNDWVLHVSAATPTEKSSAGATSPTEPDAIVVTVPTDGGSPREPGKLTHIAANRYRLDLTRSEKHDGVVVGQFLVDATNKSAAATVALDLSGAVNHYCYYRTPAGTWRRTTLDASGTSLQLLIPPGTTRISSIPWFTYGEYIAYVESLKDSRITKEVAFTVEDGKYKVYRIRVTNPTGVKNKLKICFGKAMHAHETSAFFMTQGVIQWLLSGDPVANLDNIVWTFYPCADPQAAYNQLVYSEAEKQIYDTGKPGRITYNNDIAAGHHHLIQITHMWNNEAHNLEHESYEYWDPDRGSNDKVTYPPAEPDSKLYRDWLAYWPHWFEWGTDTYWHRNGRYWPPLGGGAMMINETYYYGKDSGGDVAENLRLQGKEWARAMSQVYMHFQKDSNHWTASHPCGAVDLTGAVLLPKPAHTLLETLAPVSGTIEKNRNGNGQPMVIFDKQYDHGLGGKAGSSVTYEIPAGVDAFKAVVALDDAQADQSTTAKFVVKLDEREVWRSQALARQQSEMVHLGLPGRGRLTLSVEGPAGTLGNWAGAKFTANDPDVKN